MPHCERQLCEQGKRPCYRPECGYIEYAGKEPIPTAEEAMGWTARILIGVIAFLTLLAVVLPLWFGARP